MEIRRQTVCSASQGKSTPHSHTHGLVVRQHKTTHYTRHSSHARTSEARTTAIYYSYSGTVYTSCTTGSTTSMPSTSHISQPEDFYTAISDATNAVGDSHYVDLDTLHTMYLLEFYKIVKIRGLHSPYACIEWPGIQIP